MKKMKVITIAIGNSGKVRTKASEKSQLLYISKLSMFLSIVNKHISNALTNTPKNKSF